MSHLARSAPVIAGIAALAIIASARAIAARPSSVPTRATETLTAEPPAPAAPVAHAIEDDDQEPETLDAQRLRLFARMQSELELSSRAMASVRAIFGASDLLGQGNPAISKHPMKRSECRRIREDRGVYPARRAACGAPGMVPIYDADRGETAADARVCIDQLEFPDIPCEYPVVQVRPREAALLCEAVGKRLCDAHEWEGACAGSLHPAEEEYRWDWPRNDASFTHNVRRAKVWAYGPAKNHGLCATGSFVTKGCEGGGWETCGSNTYPTGAFPECQSPFGVFDQHGNAAEHMNLPTRPEELTSRGGDGVTEMKGSWFVFSTTEAHEDDCRYRAPPWHETRVMNEKSHRNYHLGFRCCKDVGAR